MGRISPISRHCLNDVSVGTLQKILLDTCSATTKENHIHGYALYHVVLLVLL